MEKPNQMYWMSRSGAEYQQQQRQRTVCGNPNYAQQEAWLTARVESLAQRLGRPVRVLEFGCGFGRFARLFASNASIEYYGYDFSQSMVQPLLDDLPRELASGDRIGVAPTVVDAFGDRKFDVVFTVSVLIHNEPETVAQLLQQMTSLLLKDGELWLIENALTSIGLRENNWHGGCWLHDFAGLIPPDMDICVFHQLIEDHAVYVVRRSSLKRVIELASDQDPVPRPTSLQELQLLGLPRLQAAVALSSGEMAERAELQAETHDLGEKVRFLNDEIALLKQAVNNALAVLNDGDAPSSVNHSDVSSPTLCAQLELSTTTIRSKYQQMGAAQNLRALVVDALSRVQLAEPSPVRKPLVAQVAQEISLPYSAFAWDDEQDVRLMNHHEGFEAICHVFNREWIGIRAAAGALPGHKLAISAKREMSASDVGQVINLLRAKGITKLVIHGMSEPLYALIVALAKARSFEMFLVWHGAPAMWLNEHERKLVGFAINLTQRGVIKKMNAMRLGTEPLIGERAYPKLLLNMPPRISDRAFGAPINDIRKTGAVAFIPSWHLLHKNVATCTLAAHITPEIREIWLLDDGVAKRLGYKDKLKSLSPRSGLVMLETMRQADVIINVSLIDCHPMVDLEALAVGTPCLRGPLFLDALEDHPYVGLTETENVLSVADISRTIRNVLQTGSNELSDMMNDYKRELIAVSVNRYREFLEL
jgi:SAM-dependent methyltransferase